MRRFATSLFVTLLTVCCLLPASVVSAQSPSSGCSDDPAFAAFDFWVGEWDVYGAADGKHVGVNSIAKVEGGCALVEQWQGDGGSTGMSINYYNPVTGQWRQLWISAGAYSIDIAGSLVDGSMVLEGTIWYYGKQAAAGFRGTWTPNPDGSVRQFFEQQNADESWGPWFDGRYVRREPGRE